MSLILKEPKFYRQWKMNSCWFACLQMLLHWHTGDGSITDKGVTGLASHFFPRSYDDIPRTFRQAHGLYYQDTKFTDTGQIEAFLKQYGPFMGGGKVGKLFVGKRLFGHAILIYGVLPDGHILHHDPMAGAHSTMKGDNYLRLQDGERLFKHDNPRVEIAGQGS
jgi:hypothetical protein